eukprot:5172213-Amphidinium_carterae.1
MLYQHVRTVLCYHSMDGCRGQCAQQTQSVYYCWPQLAGGIISAGQMPSFVGGFPTTLEDESAGGEVNSNMTLVYCTGIAVACAP